MIDAVSEEKDRKLRAATRHFVSKKLNKLAKYAKKSAFLKEKAKIVRDQVGGKQQRIYF